MVERWQNYQIDTGQIAAAAVPTRFEKLLDSDAPFMLRGLGCFFSSTNGNFPLNSNLGAVQLRYSRPDGRFNQRTFCNLNSALGAGLVADMANNGLFAPVFPNIAYPPQSNIEVELVNTFGDVIPGLRIVFFGTKLYAPGVLADSYGYPAQFRAVPYTYDVQVALAATDVQRERILHVDGDADFVWQGGTWTDGKGGNAVNDCGCRFHDQSGKWYADDYIWNGHIFGNFMGERPGLVVPEIYIPKNGNLYFDVRRQDAALQAATVTYSFRGIKVYPR